MDYVIRIDFTSNENKVTQRGTFLIKGRSPEQAALDFWKWIKKTMPYDCQLDKAIVDAVDITEKVMELEQIKNTARL